MKLTEQKKEFGSNVGDQESVQYGISDIGFVLDLLRNKLYENKVKAGVQEYISNARDASREAGTNKKIIVTFPTGSAPTFSVRDFGPGLTPERITEVFRMYGSSTKRNSNTQTGGFGVGSKSGHAYTDSFTIESFVDGTKRTYVSHVGDDSKGQIDLMSVENTSEDNGVRISYSVRQKDISEFSEAIIKTTMFWEEHEYPVFVNHERYQARLDAARKCGITRFMDTNLSGVVDESDYSDRGKEKIVIDGIQYPMPDFNIPEYNQLKQLIKSETKNLNIFIPNGMVGVAVSREKIDNSEFSRKGLKQIFTAAIADYKHAVDKWEADIVDAKSMLSAQANHGGFILSSSKEFDYLTFTNNKYNLKSEIGTQSNGKFEVSEYLWRKIGVKTHKEKKPENNFVVNPSGPDQRKFYMIKAGCRGMELLYDFVSDKKLGQISLLVIKAEKKTMVEAQDSAGNTIKVPAYLRDEKLVEDLVESAKRLGFVDIESVVAKAVPRAREKKAPRVGDIMLCSIYDTKAADTLMKPEQVDAIEKKGDWIYYVGAKADYEYGKYIEKAGKFRKVSDLECVFRVLPKFEKLLKDDPRFIEQSQYFKDWKPGPGLIRATALQEFGNTGLYNRLNNIVKNMANKSHPLYKASKCIDLRGKYDINYEVKQLVVNSPEYQKIKAKVKKIVDLTDKYLPFLHQTVKDNDKHYSDYINWGIDNAIADGVDFSTLDIL